MLSIYPSFSSLHFFPNSGPESFSPLQNSYERQFNHIHCRKFIYYNFLLFIVSVVTLHFFWLVRHQFLPLDYYVCECPLHSQSNFFDEEFTGHSHICPRVHSKIYLYLNQTFYCWWNNLSKINFREKIKQNKEKGIKFC